VVIIKEWGCFARQKTLDADIRRLTLKEKKELVSHTRQANRRAGRNLSIEELMN
jgi:hypothetical protein